MHITTHNYFQPLTALYNHFNQQTLNGGFTRTRTRVDQLIKQHPAFSYINIISSSRDYKPFNSTSVLDPLNFGYSQKHSVISVVWVTFGPAGEGELGGGEEGEPGRGGDGDGAVEKAEAFWRTHGV